ncbi:MAG: methyl-accepting chemotaxis protein [Deltaproteobacteria bacterium]|nr:methyl-accepting chemotaxis protein [Deltaproteobacteria bacterium]
MKISQKLMTVVASGVVALGIVAVTLSITALSQRGRQEITHMKTMMLEARKEKLKDLVNNADSVIEDAFKQASNVETLSKRYEDRLRNVVEVIYTVVSATHDDAGIPEDQRKKMALDLVKKSRYNKDDYFWINDSYPVMIMHPFKPELDGKDLTDFKDPNGKHLFVDMVKVCTKDSQGFVDYLWPKPGADKPVPKLSYVKLFKPWGWIIGSGIYMEVAQADTMKRTAEIIGTLRYGPENKDYFWINDTHPNMIMHPFKPDMNGQDLSDYKDPNGKRLFVEMAKVCTEQGQGYVEYMWPKPGFAEPVGKMSYVKLFKPWNWIVGTGLYLDDLNKMAADKEKEVSSAITRQLISMVAFIVVFCGLIIGVTIFISRRISRPIRNAGLMLKDIAEGEGDLTKRLQVSSKDEVGDMSNWFNVFIQKLAGIIECVAGNAQTLGEAASSLTSISDQISSGAQQTSAKSTSVAAAAEEMSYTMNSVAGSMGETSSNVSLVASSSDEMTAVINELARNAEKAKSMTDRAVSQARNAAAKVKELGHAAEEISRVTEAITEISDQTNLLALNATIEAARAGDAGKGFAVVANEVKELARQTAAATEEIRKEIEGIQKSTTGVVTEIGDILGIINSLNEMVSAIAAAVEEQSAATNEIAGNASNAARGIEVATDSVHQTAAAAEAVAKDVSAVDKANAEIFHHTAQLTAKAKELNKLANELKEMMSRFKYMDCNLPS